MDEEKSLATWVHRYLELPLCRSLETKAACYAGAGAMMMALHWLAHPSTDPDAKALVVMADQSRMHLGKPYEYALGGAGAAVLLSRRPRALRVRLGESAVCTIEREDLIRPDPYVEIGDTELSLISYLEALHLCIDALEERRGRKLHPLEDARWNLYHAPFGGRTFLGHKALLGRYGSRTRPRPGELRRRSAPLSTSPGAWGRPTRRAPSSGCRSVLDPRVEAGDAVSVFAYGAGSQAELYFADVGPEFRDVLAESGLERRLEERYLLTVAEYEALERARHELAPAANVDHRATFERDPLYRGAYRGKGRLVLTQIEDHQRRYVFS